MMWGSGSVSTTRKSTRNLRMAFNRATKPVNKKLDRIAADLLRRRPRNGSNVGPKTNGGVDKGIVDLNHSQGFPSVTCVLPSWHKKFKGQLPDNVRESQELIPSEGMGRWHSKNMSSSYGPHQGSVISREPTLHSVRNDVRGSKQIRGGSREKRIVGEVVVGDNSLH